MWAGEVGERLITDVTRLIDRLESRGLVRRKREAEDRRAMCVYITDGGRDCLAALDNSVHAMPRSMRDARSARSSSMLPHLVRSFVMQSRPGPPPAIQRGRS
ncbi:MAG TPA: MarR family transcriptional regulator [Longimicrobiales bacterium]|nr:MarR family transcriptional regulator [Longimicrobiales bacterium]